MKAFLKSVFLIMVLGSLIASLGFGQRVINGTVYKEGKVQGGSV